MPETRTIDDLLEHAAFARRLARALVTDAARADDVVQQTWLSALEHPPRSGRGLKAWLGTVVRNTAAKLRRDESRRETRERRAATPEPMPSAADVAAQLAAQRELLDAVARLDEPARSTIHARFFEERTPTQIAAAQGIPVRTVETRLRRAIERLRAELDERIEGGRRAWVGLLVGGSVVAIKTKSASAIAVSALILATAATVVVTAVHHERAKSNPVVAPAAAVAQESPRAAGAETRAVVADSNSGTATPTREPLATAITVVAPDGVGVPGAALVLFHGEETLGAATTDANGAASLPIEDSPCRLFVFPCAAPAKVVEVAANTRALEVTYDEGVLFSGHVVVEGRPPTAPMTLSITTAGLERLIFPVSVPDSVAMRLRALRAAKTFELSATTDRDGAFTFFGLAPHVDFCLHIPTPYEESDRGENAVRFDEAREGVLLALRFNPSIHGRIVDAQGAPLAGWKVEGFAGSADESSSQPPVESDASGVFRLYVHEGSRRPTSFSVLYVSEPGGAFARRVDIDACVDRGFDAGDVVIETRRVVALDPRDESGRPIERFAAVVERKLEAHEMRFRSNRDVVAAERARAGLLLPDGVRSLSIVAPGFGEVDVEAKPATSPVAVTLPTAASLELVVHDGDQPPSPMWTLELLASKWAAAWSRDEVTAAHAALGGSPMAWNHRQEDDKSPLRLGPMKDGRFVALALQPGLPTTLVLRDRHAIEVLREVVDLRPGETLRLERTLAEDAVSIDGFVHDENGRPLPKTRIEWRLMDAVDLNWSGADGRFRLENVRDSRVTLLFEAPGRKWKWVRDLDLRALSGELDVELGPGRSTWCLFFRAPGDPPPSAVWIEPKSTRPTPDGGDLPPEIPGRLDGEHEVDGAFAFPDLPDEPLLLRARIGDFTFALDVIPNEMPTYNTMLRGPVEVDWSIAPATANGRTLSALRLLPLDRRGARATLPITASDAARGSGLARIEKLGLDRYAVALVWREADGSLTEEKSDVVVDVARNPSARVTLAR